MFRYQSKNYKPHSIISFQRKKLKIQHHKLHNLKTKNLFLFVFSLAINGILFAQQELDISTIKTDSGYFKSFDNIKIYYEVRGEGEPILLIHGFIVNSSNWKKTELYSDLLKSHFKVITLDLRGNGKSDHPHVADAYANDAEAKDIMGLLKFLHIGHYKAVGYSRGSIIAARLLVLDKNLVKGVLGGMGTGFTDPNWDRPRQIYEALSGKDIAEFEPMKENIRKNGLDSVALAFMQLHQPATLPSALSKIDQPVLIISGDQDNFSSAEALSKMIRNSKLVSIPGTHNTASSTAAFSAAVIKFLKEK